LNGRGYHCPANWEDVAVKSRGPSITVRVHARASRAKAAWKGDVLEVWVTAAPVEGAANQAVLRTVARELGVPVSALNLRSGARGRIKKVEIRGH
jgi:uncharacterized protein YggU (UPF0235/DUF167 family)